MATREMTKEEKEAALDKKMEEMRRKNAEREKRHALVQADLARAKEAGNYVEVKASSVTSPTAVMTENPLVGVQQEQKRPAGRGRGRASLKPKVDTEAPPPGPVGFLNDPRREGPLSSQDSGPRRHPRNFGGNSIDDVKSEMRNRTGMPNRPNSHGLPSAKEMEATMTGRERIERQQWVEERQRADEARLARQRSGQGEGWRREWDKGKTQTNDDVPLPPMSHRSEPGQRPEHDQQQQRYYHDNARPPRNQTYHHADDNGRDYDFHESRRKPPRQRLGEYMPQQHQHQQRQQGQHADNNGEGEVRRRPVKERLGPLPPQATEDASTAHVFSGGQGQKNRRQSDREQFEDATAQPGGNRKAALNKERQDKRSEESQEPRQETAAAAVGPGNVHHFAAKPQRVNKPPSRAQRQKQQQLAAAAEGTDVGASGDAGQDDGAKKRKQHAADSSPKSAPTQAERKVHDKGDHKAKSEGNTSADNADQPIDESGGGDNAESSKQGAASKRSAGFKVGRGGSYGKARRPPRARQVPKSKAAAAGGKASVSSTGDEGENAGEEEGEGEGPSTDGQDQSQPAGDSTAAAAADEDGDVDDETLKQFIEEHTLKLDVQIAAMGSLSLVDGSVTSPEMTMKTPVGHVHVPDWGAAMDDADKGKRTSVGSVSSSKDLAERQMSADPSKEEKAAPQCAEDAGDEVDKVEDVSSQVELAPAEKSTPPSKESIKEGDNSCSEATTSEIEDGNAESAAAASTSEQASNDNAVTTASHETEHCEPAADCSGVNKSESSSHAAEEAAASEPQQPATGGDAVNESKEEHKGDGDHASPNMHKTASSEDHSDDTGSSDTFVLADEGSASPDSQHADRASSV